MTVLFLMVGLKPSKHVLIMYELGGGVATLSEKLVFSELLTSIAVDVIFKSGSESKANRITSFRIKTGLYLCCIVS